jgi:hypothetical protein
MIYTYMDSNNDGKISSADSFKFRFWLDDANDDDFDETVGAIIDDSELDSFCLAYAQDTGELKIKLYVKTYNECPVFCQSDWGQVKAYCYTSYYSGADGNWVEIYDSGKFDTSVNYGVRIYEEALYSTIDSCSLE